MGLILLFLLVMLPPAATLVGLGVWLLDQDRALESQRELERREAAADALVLDLSQFVTEKALWSDREQIPEKTVGFTVSAAGVRGFPEARLLWAHAPQPLEEAAAAPFEEAEVLKEQSDPESALAVYRSYATSPNPSVRAGALQRAARVERQRGRVDAALVAYRELAEIPGVSINGLPADLVARRALCDVLRKSGREQEFRRELGQLEADFLAGRWRLQRSDWELVESNIEEWTGQSLSVSQDRRALSGAMEWIDEQVRRDGLASLRSEGLILDDGPVTVVWRGQQGAILAPAMIRQWTTKAVASNPGMRVSLVAGSGGWAAGSEPGAVSARGVVRNARDTGLPWTVVVDPGDLSGGTAEFAGRRRLLSWGLAAIVALLMGGGYFLWRVIERELAVARLQTDFVAAVSHEFRTPLTSLRHVTELLEEDDGMPAGPEKERRKASYDVLARNTQRLHRLVESLLDFSRMETGRRPWNFQLEDAGTLVSTIVEEFRKEVEVRGVRIVLNVEHPAALWMRADAAALTHALWNLLDNAVKYSPDGREIHVSVAQHPQGIAIAVRDEGLGIPASEHRDIFGKFVRGRKARELGIKGTGLGLALVSYIVEAHGGSIELESEEGKGSSFRLVLPRSEQSEFEEARSTGIPSHSAPQARDS